MRLFRTLALAALAVTVAGSVVGCGGAAPAPADQSEEGGTIRLVTPIFEGTDGKKVLDGLLAEFKKKQPKFTVQVDYTTYAKLNEKLATSVASGRPYDVMMMGVGWIPPFASRGVLADLEADPKELAKTYAERVVTAGVYDGKVYALPVMLDTRFGVYRKDLFAEAGLTKPPSNFDELREYAKKLTTRDAKGKLTRAGVDILSNDTRQTYETLMWAAGGALFDDAGTKPTFNSPEAVKALQLMTDLVRTDKSIDVGFSSPDAATAPIINGRAAMAVAHNNLWLQIQEQAPDLIKQDKIGTFVIRDAQPAMFQGGTIVTMSAKTQYKAAARDLVDFLAGPDSSLAASQQRGNVPAVNSLQSSEYVQGNAFVQFAMSNLDKSYSEGGVPGWLEIRGDFKGAIESALLGQKTPQEALDELANKATSAMQRR
ncbi:ABC transporter substrate-binding protein [Tenggerimyces flavus]|uniref:ABC transporter substrate-binding protein n=1 Tax=Tenggerimyces flavus TaxID=1708749 RepID=A0ABV7YN83_9ACTN|nr:ABC transporter substrate-binding protein [Tenggerimyces flavus]MBM7786426.1 multiple sugar transport system substrate-binding protein [Tenggerimyces flavus]